VTACVRAPAEGGGRDQRVAEFPATVQGLPARPDGRLVPMSRRRVRNACLMKDAPIGPGSFREKESRKRVRAWRVTGGKAILRTARLAGAVAGHSFLDSIIPGVEG
jgi:hypothetical protein